MVLRRAVAFPAPEGLPGTSACVTGSALSCSGGAAGFGACVTPSFRWRSRGSGYVVAPAPVPARQGGPGHPVVDGAGDAGGTPGVRGDGCHLPIVPGVR